MDRFAIRGTKKLFSLARTKIRLAEESDTVYTRPKPLPLVKLLSGVEINTVKEAKDYREKLHSLVDFSDSTIVARAVFELLDIVEGVKHKFEPPELCVLVGEDELKAIEKKAVNESLPINLLLMTEKAPEGVDIFIGEEPLENSLHLGRVPSTLAIFLNFAFNSSYLSEGSKLKNIRAILGRKTLILDAIHFSLGEFGAELG